MRTLALGITALIVLSLVAMGSVAASGPEQVDRCDDAPVLSEGTHTGALTPEGHNLFRLDLSQGEYATVGVEFDERDLNRISTVRSLWDAEDSDAYGTWSEGDHNSEYQPEESSARGTTWGWFENGGEVEIWAEEPPVCVEIRTRDDNGGTYTMSIAEGDNSLPEIVTTDEAEDLHDQIDSLESQNADLEDEIDALETELENAEVDINVMVEPAEQASFQVGTEMRVNIDAEGTSPSDVLVDFGGEQYTPTDGTAAIPLESVGTHEMTVEYGDKTETLTLDVDDEGTDDGSTADQDPGTDDDIPGFGIMVGLKALLAVTGLAVYQRTKQI